LKIRILLTGGTIGIPTIDSVLSISDYDKAPRLLHDFKKERPDSNVEFSCETLFNVLSENMTISNWRQIYDSVKTLSKKDCDGIIITHGTDTLAYTAAFLSMMLTRTDVPVLLVSSNYPIDHEMSNGLFNLIAAVDFITNVGTKGVFVPFCKNGKSAIHLGARMVASAAFFSLFSQYRRS
jgi:L-asparaginase